jgi:exonuclease I
LTEENFQKEIDINLLEGKTSILEFNPVYQRDRVSGYTFYKGIHDFKVYLNEKEIDPL